MLYVGIDVHKVFCQLSIVDDNGVELENCRVPNSVEGVASIHRLLGGRPARAVIESTANLWFKVYSGLERLGVPTVLSNPLKTRLISEARLKSDRVDARVLAELLRGGMIAGCYVAPSPVRRMRELLRQRTNYVRDRTRMKNRVHTLLDKHYLQLPAVSDLFGKRGREWLRVVELPDEDRLAVDTCLDVLRSLDSAIERLEARIAREVVDDADVRLLMTVPGVDYYTAALFINEVGDIHRFASSSRLVSWLGLAPYVSQSGESSHHGRITKRGSPRVRAVMVQAAQVAVRHDERMRARYHRVRTRRGAAKAVVAVARELVVAMYHMLKNREPYRTRRQKTVEAKLKSLERRVARQTEASEGTHGLRRTSSAEAS
jgi:transposase